MITVERYDPKRASHKIAISYLINLRNIKDFESPKLGFICFDEHGNLDVVISCGFIRKIEGGYGLWDGLITNPSKSSQIRDDSLNLIMRELINVAKNELQLKAILATSKDEHTIIRAFNHGFRLMPETFMCLNLSKDDELCPS
jgi:hypothetical protein